MTVHIGTSGWSYEHWEGLVYPSGTPKSERLDHYAKRFKTVEVNSTFFRWPLNAAFNDWYRRVPRDFVLTVKAPRDLTHNAKLENAQSWMEQIPGDLEPLTGKGLEHAVNKLGAMLVQLPYHFEKNIERLDNLLKLVPDWMRVAVEFRHDSWHVDEVYDLLEKYKAAYCVMSGARLPCILKATAPFVYVRLHGPDPDHLYAGSYSDEDLDWWAERIEEWKKQKLDVFVYFNNDWKGYAVKNAESLMEKVGLVPAHV